MMTSRVINGYPVAQTPPPLPSYRRSLCSRLGYQAIEVPMQQARLLGHRGPYAAGWITPCIIIDFSCWREEMHSKVSCLTKQPLDPHVPTRG